MNDHDAGALITTTKAEADAGEAVGEAAGDAEGKLADDVDLDPVVTDGISKDTCALQYTGNLVFKVFGFGKS